MVLIFELVNSTSQCVTAMVSGVELHWIDLIVKQIPVEKKELCLLSAC